MNSIGLISRSITRPFIPLLGFVVLVWTASPAKAALLWAFEIGSPGQTLSGSFLTDGDLGDLYGEAIYEFTVTEFRDWSYNRIPVSFQSPPGPTIPSSGGSQTNPSSNSFSWAQGASPSNPGSLASPLLFESYGNQSRGTEQGFSLLPEGVEVGGGESVGFRVQLFENSFEGILINFATTSSPTIIAPVPEPDVWGILVGLSCCGGLILRRFGVGDAKGKVRLMVFSRRSLGRPFFGAAVRAMFGVGVLLLFEISSPLRAAAVTGVGEDQAESNRTSSPDEEDGDVAVEHLIGPSVLGGGVIELPPGFEDVPQPDSEVTSSNGDSETTGVSDLFLSERHRRVQPRKFVFEEFGGELGSGFEMLTVDVPYWLFEPIAPRHESRLLAGGWYFGLCFSIGLVVLLLARYWVQWVGGLGCLLSGRESRRAA